MAHNYTVKAKRISETQGPKIIRVVLRSDSHQNVRALFHRKYNCYGAQDFVILKVKAGRHSNL